MIPLFTGSESGSGSRTEIISPFFCWADSSRNLGFGQPFGLLQYDAYGDDPFWPPENITIGYMIARPKKVDHRKYPDNPLRV